MPYEVLVSDEVVNFLSHLDAKSKRVCKNNLAKLSEPYPGRGIGDKEKLVIEGQEAYRLHIGRTYTAFYIIDERTKTVHVIELNSISEAHKKYGW